MTLQTLLLAGAMALATLPAAAQSLPSYPFIHATGDAYTFVAPDIGEIDFDISAYDPAPEAAVALVQQRIAEIQALLQELGLANSDVDVRDVRRVIRKGADPAAPEYDVKCAVSIKVRDLGKWRPLMEALLAMRNLDGFASSFAHSNRTQLERDLTAQAVREAQGKAAAMAAAFGKKVGDVAGITSGQLKNLTRAVGLMPGDTGYSTIARRAAQDRADLLMVTALRMSQSVDVLFRIK